MGNIEQALITANLIERQLPRHSRAIANICYVLASQGELSQAQTLVSIAADRDVATLGIVEGLTSTRHFKEAEDALKRVKDEERRQDGWEVLARGLVKESRVAESMEIADRLPKYRGDD